MQNGSLQRLIASHQDYVAGEENEVQRRGSLSDEVCNRSIEVMI